MPLTDVALKAAKPGEKIRKISDAGGLQIWIMPGGARLWRLAYRFDGKQKLIAFGAYPQVSLAEARRLRDAAKATLRAGDDPAAQRKVEKAAAALTTATTFAGIADEYVTKLEREGRSAATLEKVRFLLAQALPTIGERPVSAIKAAEVLAVLKKLEARGRLETAKRVRSTVGAVIRYAVSTARAESDPTSALKGAIAAPRVRHRAAITDPGELGALLRAIDAYTGQWTTKAALQLLALTFVRPGELRLARWSEFDLDRAIWTIPAERTKMRREHHVPLSRQAIAILRDLRELTGEGELVFPGIGRSGGVGRKAGPRPLSENTLTLALRRLGFGPDEASAHGFRASASTLLHQSGRFSSDAIERALAHQDTNAVRRAYARGDFMSERVEMMEYWADFLDRLREGAKVVAFPRGGAAAG